MEVPGKKFTFGKNMIMNVLKNEKYCRDCILQKTVTIDCISKTRKKNEGRGSHVHRGEQPSQQSSVGDVQPRSGRIEQTKGSEPQYLKKNAITSTGKYSRYALTDVLICTECGSRYKQ